MPNNSSIPYLKYDTAIIKQRYRMRTIIRPIPFFFPPIYSIREMAKRTYIIIIVILSILCAELVGACFLVARQYRDTDRRAAELQLRANDSKRRASELSEELSRIKTNSDRAESIVESMGAILGRNDGTLQGTREALQELRNCLEDLHTCYSSIDTDDSTGGDL